MEWESSATEVLKGDGEYGLAEFRRDLCEEIRGNLPGLDDPELDKLFRVVHDIHYWLATGNAFAEFESQFSDQPKLLPLLRAAHQHAAGNVEMLGAILQRLIMDGVSAGEPVEHAVQQATERHARVAVASPLGHNAVQCRNCRARVALAAVAGASRTCALCAWRNSVVWQAVKTQSAASTSAPSASTGPLPRVRTLPSDFITELSPAADSLAYS